MLDGFAEVWAFSSWLFEELGSLSSFPWQSLEELFTFGYNALSWEQPLRLEAAIDLLNPFSNAGEEDIDLCNGDKGVAGYTSAK